MNYSIIVHTLGYADIAEREPFQYVDRSSISAERLEFNLRNYWAWNEVIQSDGPCVAISFEGKK